MEGTKYISIFIPTLEKIDRNGSLLPRQEWLRWS